MATRFAPIVGLKGAKRSGKSHVSAALRKLVYGDEVNSDWASAADLEFSDPISEAVNWALTMPDRRFEQFRFQLAEGASWVLGIEVPPPLQYYHSCQTDPHLVCPECGVKDWLDKHGHDLAFRINRANKDEHRVLQVWEGVIVRYLVDEGVWVRKMVQKMRQAGALPLIVACGVRFPADAVELRKLRALIGEVQGPPAPDDDDPTNDQRDGIIPDVIINNQVWEPGVLEATTAEFLADFKAGRLKPVYGPSL